VARRAANRDLVQDAAPCRKLLPFRFPDNSRLADEYVLEKDRQLEAEYWGNLRDRGRFNFDSVFTVFINMALWNCGYSVDEMRPYKGWTREKKIELLGEIRARRGFRPVEDKARLLDQIHKRHCTDGRTFSQFYIDLQADVKKNHDGLGCSEPIWVGFSDGHPFRCALMEIAKYLDIEIWTDEMYPECVPTGQD